MNDTLNDLIKRAREIIAAYNAANEVPVGEARMDAFNEVAWHARQLVKKIADMIPTGTESTEEDNAERNARIEIMRAKNKRKIDYANETIKNELELAKGHAEELIKNVSDALESKNSDQMLAFDRHILFAAQQYVERLQRADEVRLETLNTLEVDRSQVINDIREKLEESKKRIKELSSEVDKIIKMDGIDLIDKSCGNHIGRLKSNVKRSLDDAADIANDYMENHLDEINAHFN